MPVRLTASAASVGSLRWCAVGTVPAGLDGARRVKVAAELERAFADCTAEWLELARTLTAPDSVLAHAPSAAGNVSDLGLMLAWTRLADQWAKAEEDIALICDDPWLFRHLAGRPGIRPEGPAPALFAVEARLALRGMAARLRAGLRLAVAAWRLRFQRRQVRPGAPALLVYGHPASDVSGFDAYFGELMAVVPEAQRLLHVDAPPQRAFELAGDGRTLSLHGFGSPLFALGLWVKRWRPRDKSWLIRRAAALEGGTGQPALIAWQIHCQARWLAAARPSRVAWPWENHGWERALVRRCRALGVATLGYQHATIGSVEWNHASVDTADLPDRILAAGVVSRDRLLAVGVPAGRLAVGGAWRFPAIRPLPADATAPVFLALPADRPVAEQMVVAASALSRPVWVREHPMTPIGFVERSGLTRAPGRLDQCGPVAAVVGAATTVVLEAALAGLPVVRFLPEGRVANDVLPREWGVPAADAAGLARAVAAARPIPGLDAARVFGPVDRESWRAALTGTTP